MSDSIFNQTISGHHKNKMNQRQHRAVCKHERVCGRSTRAVAWDEKAKIYEDEMEEEDLLRQRINDIIGTL